MFHKSISQLLGVKLAIFECQWQDRAVLHRITPFWTRSTPNNPFFLIFTCTLTDLYFFINPGWGQAWFSRAFGPSAFCSKQFGPCKKLIENPCVRACKIDIRLLIFVWEEQPSSYGNLFYQKERGNVRDLCQKMESQMASKRVFDRSLSDRLGPSLSCKPPNINMLQLLHLFHKYVSQHD